MARPSQDPVAPVVSGNGYAIGDVESSYRLRPDAPPARWTWACLSRAERGEE